MFFYVYQHQNFDYLIINQVQVPLSVVVAWIMGIQMDLDFKLLETGCLAFGIIVTAFTLQVYIRPISRFFYCICIEIIVF